MAKQREKGEQGSALLILMVILVSAMILALATMDTTFDQMKSTETTRKRMQALYVAESGLEHVLGQLQLMMGQLNPNPPFSFNQIHSLLVANSPFLSYAASQAMGLQGQYQVTVSLLQDVGANVPLRWNRFDPPDQTNPRFRDYLVEATAAVPGPGVPDAVRRTARAVIRSTLHQLRSQAPSVFTYAYFINHWGWFYGSNIVTQGNVKSNGAFSFTNGATQYRPTINPIERYRNIQLVAGTVDTWEVTDHTPGDDGGIYAGHGVDAAPGQVRTGAGGSLGASDIYQADGVESMPNLNDFASYENLARSYEPDGLVGGIGLAAIGSKVQVWNAATGQYDTVVADGVLGDNEALRNLYLEGDAVHPIRIDGPVVIRGNVIIRGNVQGNGALYAAGNIYIAGPLRYQNPPLSSFRTNGNSPYPQGRLPAYAPEDLDNNGRIGAVEINIWLNTNNPKRNPDYAYTPASALDDYQPDSLALLARENVVLGEVTQGQWRRNVTGWINHPMNLSHEDSGEDNLPRTADDFEADRDWVVRQYTAADAAVGLIPPGLQVGDAIRETGEDTDGDAFPDGLTTIRDDFYQNPRLVYDPAGAPVNGGYVGVFNGGRNLTSNTWGRTTLVHDPVLDPGGRLLRAEWAGPLPGNGATVPFGALATNALDQICAVIYTNHSLPGLLDVGSGRDIEFNGATVSRNEDIVYNARTQFLNHDYRAVRGDGMFGFYLSTQEHQIQVLSRNVE